MDRDKYLLEIERVWNELIEQFRVAQDDADLISALAKTSLEILKLLSYVKVMKGEKI